MQDKTFFDSNLWVYFFTRSTNTDDISKKNAVKDLLLNTSNLFSSAQVFNEVANVLLKKFKFSETNTLQVLQEIDELAHCIPLTNTLSFKALDLKLRY